MGYYLDNLTPAEEEKIRNREFIPIFIDDALGQRIACEKANAFYGHQAGARDNNDLEATRNASYNFALDDMMFFHAPKRLQEDIRNRSEVPKP